ncbi:MAG: hypothetical protein WC333_00810 [Dehalococcoidia bacterium]|jgi:hypothetical protein
MATFTLDLLTGQEYIFSFSGLKGDKGDPGASGVTTVIYSGLTVFSGVSPTVVTTSYSGQTQIISIYTPSGATGAQGDQGIPGVSGATGAKGDSGQTIVNYYTFIPSGGTLISVGSGNTVVIYSPTGATGGFTGYTFIASGSTQISVNGNYVTIYSIPATGSTATWGTLTGKPAWLTGTTLQQFEEGHEHDQYSLTGHTHSQYSLTGHTHSQYLTGVTWNDVTSKPNLTLQSDFSVHTGDTAIHYQQSAITITESQVLNLVSDLAGKSNTGHTHGQYLTISAFTAYSGSTFTGYTFIESGGTQIFQNGNVVTIYSVVPSGSTVAWIDITGKPNLTLQSDFSIHTGDTTIHYVQSAITINQLQVVNLVSDLAGKSSTGHTHPQYSLTGHTHSYTGGSITNLPELFTGHTFIQSGATVISVNGDYVTIYSPTPTGSTGGFTGYTFIESGGTQIFQNGNVVTIYSVVPSGSTVAWIDITGKPNLTLQSDFASHTGNTGIHYTMSQITGFTTVAQFTAYTATTISTVQKVIQLKDVSGGTDANLISGVSINWTTQEYTGSSFNYTGGSRIYVTETGVYGISYVLNVYSQSGSSKNVGTVVRKNGGIDITPTSSTSLAINIMNKSGTNIMPTYRTILSSGDYVELFAFRMGDAGVMLTKPDGSWIMMNKI